MTTFIFNRIKSFLKLSAVLAALFMVGQTSAFAQEESASDLALKSSNPLGGQFIFWYQQLDNFRFDGDLPDAQDKGTTVLNIQPFLSVSLEDSLGEGWSFVDRPTISPVFSSQLPTLGPDGLDYKEFRGFADPSNFFLLGYSQKSNWFDGGLDLVGFGMANSFPLGSDKFSSERWTAGPAFTAAHLGEEYILATLIQHFWDIGETSECNGCPGVNKTSFQYVYYKNLDDGWQVGATPIINIDWNNQENTEIPVAMGVYKTGNFFGSKIPTKVGLEANYYVRRNKDFGPRWDFRFVVAPILPSPWAK